MLASLDGGWGRVLQLLGMGRASILQNICLRLRGVCVQLRDMTSLIMEVGWDGLRDEVV